MAKLDNTAASAMEIYAKLQGISPSSKAISEDVEIEIEFEDEKKATKKKKQTKPKKVEAPKRVDRVPDLDKFNKLSRNTTIQVQQVPHDIHYKEQIWGIPSRMITYNLEVISSPKVAKDTAIMFKCTTPEDLRDAEMGEVRYLKIVSYDNIPYRSRELGYIQVKSINGRLDAHALFKNKQMKENNINAEKVKKQINKVMNKLLGKE